MSTSLTPPGEQRTNWRQRIILALLIVAGIVVGYTLLYQWAMGTYADQSISFLHSLRIVIESLTTAGFGGDTDYWTTTPLHVIVILMNISGVFLVFLALPLFVVPLFREVVKPRAPRTSSLEDHVIICGYSMQDEILRAELEAVDIPYLYIDEDEDLVVNLNDRGINAMLGDPEESMTLEDANVGDARALVADLDDETNPTVILSAKQVNPDIRTISVARDYAVERYHRLAGADEVVLSRQILGKSLGMRAAVPYAEQLKTAVSVEEGIEITEFLVQANSPLVGKTIEEVNFLEKYGIRVIGAWVGGKFLVSPKPDTTITEHSILLVAGQPDEFEELHARVISHNPEEPRRIIVCGQGTVGWSAIQTIREEDFDVEVIDIDPGREDVDIVGDATNPQTLKRAGLSQARAVVLALDDDASTIYATLIIKELAPHIEIIARARDPETIWKLYNAGADFVLSLSTVTGEILANHLIEDGEILTPDIEFGFKRVDAGDMAGKTLGELDIRVRTGCTVVAVERAGGLLTDLGGAFQIQEGDVLILAGSEPAREHIDDLIPYKLDD